MIQKETLVAALSNCHMLSFLHVARLAGFTVTAYRDHAEGGMQDIAPGKQAVTKSRAASTNRVDRLTSGKEAGAHAP